MSCNRSVVNRAVSIVLASLLLQLGSIAVGSAKEGTKVRNLKLSTFYTETMSDSGPMKQFVKDVKDFTDGGINIRIYWLGEIAQIKELAELVQSGGLDLATISPLYHASLFPLGVATSAYPTLLMPPEQAVYAWRSLQDNSTLIWEEYAKVNMYPLNRKAFAGYRIISKKPIYGMADLKGMKIRMAGTYMEAFFKAAGATTKRMPYSELYEALMRGLVDGIMIDAANALGLKLHEVGKYMGSPMGGMLGPGPTINLDLWKSFTPDIREAFQRAATKWGENDLRNTLDGESQAIDALKQKGIQFVDFDKKDYETMINTAGNPYEHCRNWLIMDMKIDPETVDQFIKVWRGAIEEYQRDYVATGKKWKYE